MSDEPAAGARGQTTVTEPTRAQAQLARRVAESRATVPDLTLSVEADIEDAPDAEPVDLVVHAAARALRAHPQVNGAYRDGRLEAYARVNVAVLLEADGALVAPTIFDADTLTLEEIATQRAALEARVRSGESTAPELRGATFSVYALDVRRFAAPVPAGQAAILNVGAAQQRAVVRDGSVEVRRTLDLTLACDHRAVYGELAAGFLAAVAAGLTSR